MRSNERLQRVLAIRQLSGSHCASVACGAPASEAGAFQDLRLFALTFAWGFLFTSIFIA